MTLRWGFSGVASWAVTAGELAAVVVVALNTCQHVPAMGETEREELKIEKGGSQNNHNPECLWKHFKLKASNKRMKKEDKIRAGGLFLASHGRTRSCRQNSLTSYFHCPSMGECSQRSFVSRAARSSSSSSSSVRVRFVMQILNYIITDRRGRALREEVDGMRGSDWLPPKNACRGGGMWAWSAVQCSHSVVLIHYLARRGI